MKKGVRRECAEEAQGHERRENSNSVRAVQTLRAIDVSVGFNSGQLRTAELDTGYCIGSVHFSLEQSAFKPFCQIKSEVAANV